MIRLDPPTGLGPVGPRWTNWMGYLYIFLKKWQHIAQSLAPTAVGANSTSEQSFTVPGLDARDAVYVNKPSYQAGLSIVNARVAAKDTLRITYLNTTAGSITPTTEIYKIVAVRGD